MASVTIHINEEAYGMSVDDCVPAESTVLTYEDIETVGHLQHVLQRIAYLTGFTYINVHLEKQNSDSKSVQAE